MMGGICLDERFKEQFIPTEMVRVRTANCLEPLCCAA